LRIGYKLFVLAHGKPVSRAKWFIAIEFSMVARGRADSIQKTPLFFAFHLSAFVEGLFN